jgi:hypothetical protein
MDGCLVPPSSKLRSMMRAAPSRSSSLPWTRYRSWKNPASHGVSYSRDPVCQVCEPRRGAAVPSSR